MKKYFKLGTALAFSVLLNLTPTLITNVKAEEQKNSSNITETINDNEVYYQNQLNFDDSSIIEEEPLEVKESANEQSTAEANNIEVSEPARAPTNEKSDEENNEDIEITNDNNDEVISVKAASDRIQTEAPIITVKSSDSALSGTTTIENRTDAVLYKPKYKFTIDNYIGNLRIKIIDILPYTVTQESINALNGELNGKTLTWYVDLGNFNTYDEEGNSNPLVIDNISNPIDFSLKYSNIPLNVTRFNNTIKLRVEYRYIKDGEEIIEEQPIIVNSSNKETTKNLYTNVKTVNEETKKIELTVDKETATTSVAENGTDIITEPITYNVKYNFDATNYNGNTKATVTVTLPGEIDIEAPETNIPKDGKYNGTSSTKTIVWTQDIPASGERCTSEGICETENISDEFNFTVVYKNPTKALNVSAKASIQTPSGSSNASTNTDTVTVLTNVGAKINFHFVNQEGQAIENAPNYSIDANLGDKLTMASYKKTEEMENLHYEYDKACRLSGENCTVVTTLTVDNTNIDINMIYKSQKFVTINYKDSNGNLIENLTITNPDKKYFNNNTNVYFDSIREEVEDDGYYHVETKLNGTKTTAKYFKITSDDNIVDFIIEKYRLVTINYLGEDEKPLNIEGIVPVKIKIRKGGQISSQYIPNLEKEYYYVNGYRLNGENVSSYTVSIQEKENNFDVIYYKRRLITLNYLDEYNNPIEGVEVKTYNYKKDTSLSLTSTTNKKDLKNIKYSYLETCIVNGNECVKTTESSIIITEDTIINYIYAKYRNVTINYKDRHGKPIEGVDPVTTELKKYDKLYRRTYNKDLSENNYYLGDVVVNGVVNNNNMITIEEEEYVIDYLYEKRTNNNIIHVTTHVENYDDPYSETDQTYNKELRSSTVSSYIRTADILGIENIIIRVDDQTYYATKIEDASEELDYGNYDNPNFYYLEEQNYTSMYYNPRFINEHEDIDVDFYYAFTDKEHDYNVIINYLFLDDDSILLARDTQEITNYYGMDWLKYLYNYTNFLQDRGLTKDESNNVLYYEREVFNYKAEELVDRRYKYPNITGYLDGFGSMQVDLGVMVDDIGILPIQHSTGIELNPAELDIDENGYNFGNKLYGNMPHSDINIVLLFGKASVINVKHIYLDNGAERILKEEFYDDSKLPLEKNYITTNVIEDPNIKYIGYKDEFDAQWQDNHKLEELGEEDISWKETEMHPSKGEKSYKIAYQQILFSKYTRYLYYETNIGQIKIHHIDTEGNHITVDKLGNNVTSLYEYTGEIGTSFEDKLGPIEIAGYQNISTNATDFSNNYNYTKELIQIFYVYDVLKYNLDFVTNGGTSVESEVLEYNTPVTISNYNTERDYYYFDGWYKDEEFTEKASDFNILEDTTLYAKWVKPEDYPDTPESDWDVSKSKTATPLDENLQTEIEIALPSSKEELETTVVFVIDNSSSTVTDAITEAQSVVDTLMEQVRESGAKVNIAVVAFKGDAKVLKDLVVLTEGNINEVKAAIAEGYSDGSGTNIHAGLIEADKLLDMSDISSNRKYMILLTDGITRNFIGSDGNAKNIYYDFDNQKYWGEMSSWASIRGVPEGNYKVPGGDWNEYYQKVKTWVEQDQDAYVEDFKDYTGNGKPDSTFNKTYAPEGFKYIPRGEKEHAFAVDRAIYEAYEKYKEIEAKGYRLYSVQTKNYPLGKAFLEALNNGKTLSFSDIKKDILYLVDKGTVVKDYIGEDFTFVNGENPFTLKINDEELISTKVDENTYTFRKAEDEEGTYRHKVTFYDVENGYIVWDINDTIDNFTRVKLLFKEQLTNYTTEKLGEIPTDTNIVATITPVDSEGNEGETETFEKPVVEYTIGNVIAKYVDEEGNTLAEDNEYRGIVGIQTYETKEETIPLYHLIDIQEENDVTGTYQNETITVTYVYAKDTGKVIIHYIDKHGEPIHVNDELEGPIGDPYNTNTAAEKIASHEEILSNGYTYLTSTGKVEGTFTSERPINVTYIYEKLGKVIVKFLDKDTNSPVAEEETMRGNVGESYNTSSKQVELYDLDSEPENKYGDYTVEDQEVIYYYVKHKGTVITHYVDIETNKEIADQEIQSERIGNDYTTTKLNNIENYTFVNNSENITGQFTKDTIDVYYYYQKQSGDVKAIYVDALTGEKIAEDYTDNGYVDEKYTTPEKVITGYELVRVDGETSGNFKNGETIEVTYYYTVAQKIGHVIIKYQDEDGNSLAEDIPKQGIVGQEYSSEAKEFPEYQLITIPELANSIYTEESVENPIIVIYVYQKEGKVITHYVDTNGNDLANITTQTGKVGDSYTTTSKDIPNYELVGTPANKEGEYQTEITHVIYVYDLPKEEEKPNCCNNCCNTCTGTSCTSCSNSCAPYLVITRYEDENGNTIAEENVEHVAENAQYSTTKKVIDGYEFVKVSEDSDPTEGIYTVPEEGEAQPIKVTYIYKELPKDEPTPEPIKEEGILVVRYVDENDARIADDVITSELEGTKYVTSQKVIEGYTFTSVTENYKGTYNNDIIEVIYKYKKNEVIPEEPVIEPKTSYVVVKYIDENRQEIAEKVVLSGKVGEFYFTTQKQIDGYIFVEVDAEEEGTYQEDITRVTYTYKKIEEEPVTPPVVKETGILVVHYVDENDAIIATDEISSAEEGTKYVTSQKAIDGYTFTSVTDNYKGEYNNDIIEVIYRYTKNEEEPVTPPVVKEIGILVVHYVDENDAIIATDEISSAEEGTKYVTSQKAIDGYTFSSVTDNYKGEYNNDIIEVIYRYTKNEEEPVTPPVVKETGILVVRYVDENDAIIATDEISSAEEGTKYVTSQKAIDGYTFTNVTENYKGSYNNDIIEVIYSYKKNEVIPEEPVVEPKTSYVVVKYVDETGKEVAEKEIISGKVGENYFTTQKQVTGYNYVSVDKEEEGYFTEDIIRVTYTYEKIEEEQPEPVIEKKDITILVQYIDKDTGNPVFDSMPLTGKEGSSYTTIRKAKEGYNLLTPDFEEIGTYSETKTLTYYYEKVEEPAAKEEAKILVQYIDKETNNTVFDSELVEGNIGDTYILTRKSKEGYTIDNPTFAEIGEFTTPIQVFTYYYAKIKEVPVTPTPEPKTITILVQYLDKETENSIFDSVTLSGKEGETYTTTRKAKEGYNLVKPEFEELGEFTQNTVLTYYYEKIEEEPVTPPVVKETGILVVRYVDENQVAIANDEITSAEEGTKYVTSQKVIDGYTFTNVTENYKGSYNNDIIEVIYTYKKNEIIPDEPVVEAKTSYVVVKYIDENKQEIAEKVILSGKVGDFYFTTQKQIDGYVFVEVDNEEEGNYTDEIIRVTYTYEKIKEEPEEPVEEPKTSYVVVKYIDQEGQEIAGKEVLTGKVDEYYFTTQKQISGYKFVNVDAEEEGKFTEDIIRVTYTYEKIEEEQPEPVIEPKNITILVQYLDKETGNPVFDSISLTGKEGETYTTTRKSKDGYNLVNPEFEELGTYSESKVLNYYYEKIVEEQEEAEEEAYILVHYIDANGNQIKSDVVYTGNVGDTYVIPAESIPGYNLINIERVEPTPVFRLMMLKAAPMNTISKNNIGTYKSGVTEISFIYEANTDDSQEEPKELEPAMLIVRYQDTEGTAIAEDEVTKGLEGDFYNANQKVISGYKYVSVDSEETYGKLEAGLKVITYTYEKLPKEDDGGSEGTNCVCNNSCCCNTCGNNGGNTGSSESTQPVINVNIDINNENNSDNHSENNNENNVENNSDNHSENNQDTNVNNDTNVDNHNDNTTDVNNDNHTDVNNENNNQDETNVNIENNPTQSNENNNDSSIENNPVNTNENNNDGSIENNSENNNQSSSDNQNDNSSSSSSDNNNQSENNNENNPTNNNDSTNTNENINNNTCTENCEKACTEDSCEKEEKQEPKKGIVVANYLDQDGKVISASVITMDEVQKDYVTEEKDIPNYTFTNVEGNPTGKYIEGVYTVNYYYKEKEEEPTTPKEEEKDVTILVQYLEKETNNPLFDSETKTGKVGETYTTTRKAKEGYVLDTPEFSELDEYKENLILTYYYEKEQQEETQPPVVEDKKYGTIYTHYIDTKGNKLANDKVETLEVGSEYSTIKESFEGYNYITVINNTNGIVKEGEIEVTYLYEAIPEEEPVIEPVVEEGTVVVYYIDTKGNTLSEKVVIENEVGKTYLTDQKDFEDYDFVTVVGNKNGEIQKGITEVIYIYKKTTTCEKDNCQEKPVCPSTDSCKEEKTGKVVARYIDNEGNTLTEEIVTEDKVGENYVTSQKTFDGYEFVTVAGNRSGKYIDGVVEVTYIYENKNKETPSCPKDDPCTPEIKEGKVIVHYVDEEGNPLLEDKNISGEVGKAYETTKEDIDKYTFKEVKGNEKGSFTEEDIEVTYVYSKIKGKVIAHYVDTKGNMLGYDIEQEGFIDDSYTTKLRKFRGYTFTQVVGAYAGKYINGTIEVTYIYQKNEEVKPTPIDEDKTTPQKEEDNNPKKETGNTTGIEINKKDYYSSIQIPNTGITQEKNLGLFSLIMSLIAALGIVVLKDEQEAEEE